LLVLCLLVFVDFGLNRLDGFVGFMELIILLFFLVVAVNAVIALVCRFIYIVLIRGTVIAI